MKCSCVDNDEIRGDYKIVSRLFYLGVFVISLSYILLSGLFDINDLDLMIDSAIITCIIERSCYLCIKYSRFYNEKIREGWEIISSLFYFGASTVSISYTLFAGFLNNFDINPILGSIIVSCMIERSWLNYRYVSTFECTNECKNKDVIKQTCSE
jgi:hypothetical protein